MNNQHDQPPPVANDQPIEAGQSFQPIVKDLSMLVIQLSRVLRRADPEHTLPSAAMDFLKRKGLQGSPLRDHAPSASAACCEGIEAPAACPDCWSTPCMCGAPWDAFERHRIAQGKILGMPGLSARPAFFAGWNAALASCTTNSASVVQPIEMTLCESRKLVLRVGQPYVFHQTGDCFECAAMAAEARKAYGEGMGAPGKLPVQAMPSFAPTLPMSFEDLRIVNREGFRTDMPYGIRDRRGFLFFFPEVNRYEGQDDRYKEESDHQREMANYLLKCLEAVRPARAKS